MQKEKQYSKRLDFYWKYIAVYAIAIIIYALLRGSFEEWTFTVMLFDPLVILLFVFIVFTILGLFFEYSKKQILIVGNDYLLLINRFRKRNINRQIIKKIIIRQVRAKYSAKLRIIRIYLTTRRRPIIIRPSSYWNESDLINSISTLKKNINK